MSVTVDKNEEPVWVVKNPTVAELIAKLQTYPQDAVVNMVDADTNWTIDIVHMLRDTDGVVWLWGEYYEMTSSGRG